MSPYLPADVADRARAALIRTRVPTPALVIDVDLIKANFGLVQQRLPPGVQPVISTARAAAPAVWRELDRFGVHFDAVSARDADLLRRHEISSDRIRLVTGCWSSAAAPHRDQSSDVHASTVPVSSVQVSSVQCLERARSSASSTTLEVSVSLAGSPSPSELSEDDAIWFVKESDRRGVEAIDVRVRIDSAAELSAIADLINALPLAVRRLTITSTAPGLELSGLVTEAVVRDLAVVDVAVDVTSEVVGGAITLLTEVEGVSPQSGRRIVWVDSTSLPVSGRSPQTFDRELEIVEQSTVLPSGSPGGAMSLELPLDLAAGELLAFSDPVGRAPSDVAVVSNRLEALADYEIVLPGDDAMEQVEAIEFEAFEAANLISASGNMDERRFADRCRMLVVRNGAGEVSGVMRVAEPSSFGFEALHYCPLDQAGARVVNEVDLANGVEVLTLAPLNRDPVAAFQLYLAIVIDSFSRGRSIIVATMIEPVWMGVNRHLGRDGYGPFVRLGPTVPSSMYTPVMIDLWACEERLDIINSLANKVDRLQASRARR